MPELPEVETVVRTLRPRLLGATVEAVWTSGKGLRLARAVDQAALAKLSVGAKVEAVPSIPILMASIRTKDGSSH